MPKIRTVSLRKILAEPHIEGTPNVVPPKGPRRKGDIFLSPRPDVLGAIKKAAAGLETLKKRGLIK